MKRLVTLLIIFVISGGLSLAQPWLNYLPKNKAKSQLTLKDYQKAFENYVEDYTSTHSVSFDNKLDDEGKIPGYFQFKRWEWYWEPRVDPKTGAFPDIDFNYLQGQSAKALKSVGGTWTSLGPANINQDDRGTGRINCAAFDPNDNNHFWIGSASGGVWETTDGGQTWTCLTDGIKTLGVSDIALPSDYDAANNPTIYIGTGDRDALDDPSVGVLVTHDGGQTWEQTGLSFKLKEQNYVSRVIIDPNNTNRMWASTSVGIYFSDNQGATWNLLLGGNFIDMELFPGSTTGGAAGRLIASTNGFEPKIYLSTDGGQTWTVTYDAGQSYAGTQLRADVAVTQANSDIAYFIMSDYDNSYAFEALFKSTDGGQTWTEVFNQSDNNLFGWKADNSAADGGQGFYDIALAVANNDANIVYVGGVNGFISSDGGQNFEICNQWTTSANYPIGADADVVHADHHNAYFRPSDDRLFDCDDGGIYYSDNPTQGENSDWTNITAGLVNGQIYGIGVSNQSADVVNAGFQDNGTKLLDFPNTGNYNWLDVKGGDGMNCDIDPTDDDVQWGTYVQLQIDITTNRWASVTSIRSSGSAAWAGPLVADPIDAQTIYIGTDAVEKHVGTSTANNSWDDLSGSLDNTNYLRALDVYHDNNGNLVIWTASPIGVWRSDNNGGNFTEVSQNGLPNDQVMDIAIDPNDPDHVYVSLGGYDENVVYETTDAGQTWTNISEGLPEVPAGAIVVNKQTTAVKEVYVGTDAGIYVKYGNSPWQLFNEGMPYTSITDLEFYYDDNNPANTRLYASTYGRGVFKSDCYQPPALDLALTKIEEPLDEYCDVANVTPTFKVSAIGTQDITEFSIHYSIDGGAVQTKSWSGTLSQSESTNITFDAIDINFGSHNIKVWIDNINGQATDDNQQNDTLEKTINIWDNSLPYVQNFDNFDINIAYNGSAAKLQECWVNDENESTLDWSVTQGATPSNGTGPTDDHTGGGRYLYTEVSGISNATVTNVLTPEFDLSTWQNCKIEFYYYMYGANCGTLGPVQVSTDGGNTWNNLDINWESTGNSAASISGDQGQSWFKADADISAYDGKANVQIRIQSTTGTSYDGDIAIDDFSCTGDPVCAPPSTQASNINANADYTSITLSWTRGNGDAVIVLAKEGSAVDKDPVFGTSYTADSDFGSGEEIGTGNYVVYNGTGTSVTVTGLTEGSTYNFAIYEYFTSDNCYLTPGATASATCLVHPPAITSVNPTYIWADLGGTLTITGTDFNNITSVALGGVNASSYNVSSSTSITAVFPAAAYSDDTLKVINAAGTATYLFDVKTRNIIPVGSGADMHATIADALDGLFKWWGTSAFDTTKVIDVYNGTYTETIEPQNYALSPDATNRLVITAHTGETPVIDASGNDYGINCTKDYVTFRGFTINNANIAGIYTEGDNNEICMNKVTNSSGHGIYLNSALSGSVCNNLVYDNYQDGIRIEASDNTQIKNNTVFNNGYTGSGNQTVTLYFQDFENSPQDWATDNYAAFLDYDGMPDYYVSPTHSVGTYKDATIFKTDAIDVSGYTNIEISTWGRSDGDMSSSEYLQAQYSFDNNNWTTFLDLSSTQNAYVQGTESNITPTSDSLYIRYVVNVLGRGSTDYWWIADDYKVTAEINSPSGAIGAGLNLISGTNYTIENNILTGKSSGNFRALIAESGVTFDEDYNIFFGWNSDSLLTIAGTNYKALSDYASAGANDIEANPLFVDTTARDFHILSTEGSYHGGTWPPLAQTGGTWTNDASSSPALDAGNPADSYDNEPQSGNRINAGAYGNTAQASKSVLTSYVWTGNADNDWNNTDNWQNNTVPDANADVLIPSGLSNYPIVSTAANAKSITMENGASLDIETGGSLTVANSVTAGSSSTDSVTVIVNGNGIDVGQLDLAGKSALIITSGSISGTLNFATTSYAVYDGGDQTLANANYGNLIIKNAGVKSISGDATTPTSCNNLTIESGANLTIGETKALTVNGSLTNLAGYDGLVIKSGSAGDGSLIQNTDNVPATVERYFTGTQWHYFCPSVKGAELSALPTSKNLYTWDASMEWGGVGDNNPWIAYTADTLITAKGYAYYYYTTTLVFKDTLTTETYTFTLDKSATGDEANQGWNLIGNPYASALDWEQIVTQTAFTNGDIEAAIYFFDDDAQTGDQSNYRYYVPANGSASGVGTEDATATIPMGQAFFVKALTDGAQFTLSPSYRTHNSGTAFYKAQTSNEEKDILRLTISGKAGTDELVYRYVNGANPGFDKKFDAQKKYPSNNSSNLIYYLSPDKSQSMAIASDDPATLYRDINLGILNVDQDLTISLKANSFDTQSNVYLEDKYLDTIVDLAATDYTFSSEAGEFKDRFVLHFGTNRPPVATVKEIYIQTQENNQVRVKLPEFKDYDFNDSVTAIYFTLVPSWLSYDQENEIFYGVPSEKDTGLYSIKVYAKDTKGATGYATVNIKVLNINNPPKVTGELPDIYVEAGTEYSTTIEKVIKDPDNPVPLTYQVLQQDGSLLPDFITYDPLTSRLIVKADNDDEGLYYLKLVGQDVFGAKTEVPFKVTVYALSNENAMADMDFSVYPNPTSGILFISVKPEVSVNSITLTDVTGKQLELKKSVEDNIISIDMHGLNAGIYTLKIQYNDSSIFVAKIIKK